MAPPFAKDKAGVSLWFLLLQLLLANFQQKGRLIVVLVVVVDVVREKVNPKWKPKTGSNLQSPRHCLLFNFQSAFIIAVVVVVSFYCYCCCCSLSFFGIFFRFVLLLFCFVLFCASASSPLFLLLTIFAFAPLQVAKTFPPTSIVPQLRTPLSLSLTLLDFSCPIRWGSAPYNRAT